MKNTHKTWPSTLSSGLRMWSCLAVGAMLLSVAPVQGQKIWFEDFEGLTLGPAIDEAVPGDGWTKTPPPGWVQDDSGVPGVGTDLDGVTEWAGWSFANRFWWVQADNQRRDEFNLATGTVMIADPDEWDDAAHPGTGIPTEERTAQGLWYETYITTSAIDLTGQAANSLVLVFASSWRPEFDSNFQQTGVIDASYDDGTPARIMHWVSDSAQPLWDPSVATPSYKDDNSTNDEIVIALNNPAGAGNLKLTFGMFDAGNDWWWAVDNIAVGVPPFASGVSGNGYEFTINIVEALGFTVNQSTVVVELDGTAVTPLSIAPRTGGISVTYEQFPAVFEPGKAYPVTVRFTTSDGRQVVDELIFVAPSFTAVTSTPTSVTAVITDTDYGLAVNETAGIQLALDGTTVTPTSITRDGTALTIVYNQAPTVFASGSAHTLAVTFQTLDAVSVTESIDFTAPQWTAISPAIGTAVGTGAEAGLLWKTHQLATGRGTTIAEAEAQLAGDLGVSIHDPSGHTTPQGADGYFRVDWVNNEQAGGSAGRFNIGATAPLNVPDEFIPGAVNADPDNLAADIRTFLELPAGFYSMVVNSDDGFQVSTGNANNPTYQVLGSYDAGRGAADTVFYFNIETAGVYFFRLLWFEGGGGASVEWFTIGADGSAALINGEQAGAVSAYRTRTVPEPDLPVLTAVTDGLVAYWNFDGNFFDSIKDFHGTGRGTNQIAFVDGQAGFGKAIKLDGNDQFVEITGGDENELEFPGGSMSIAGWFKVDAFDTEWQALISKGEGSNYRVARRAATGTIAYAGGVGEGADNVPAVNDGQWQHFVAVTDATGAEFGTALYLNGVLHGVNTNAAVLTNSTFNLMIGENPGARGREWEGEIDDIGIWNRVLSAAEVAELYNGGTGTALSTLVDANITGIGLNFGTDQPASTVAATDVAGVPGVAQLNWNNLSGPSGTNNAIVGNAAGTAESVSVTVEWGSNGTWRSTGAGEENNGFAVGGPDHTLLTGYLDTGDPTTTTVTISGIPESLTGSQYGYDVYVYALGGVAGRGGAYQVVNPASGAAIRGYITAQSPANPSTYTMVEPTNPPAYAEGTYIVFPGLTAADIRIEATTDDPWGIGSPNRAPINAVQLVPALEAAPAPEVEITSIVVNTDGTLTVTWSGGGVLEAAASITGPWAEIEGATSPFTFPVEQQVLFGRIRVD